MVNSVFPEGHHSAPEGRLAVCGKSNLEANYVIPAKAGIQDFKGILDSSFRWSDEFFSFSASC